VATAALQHFQQLHPPVVGEGVHETVLQTDLADLGGQEAAQVLATELLHPGALVPLAKETMEVQAFLCRPEEHQQAVVEAALAQLVLMALLAKVELAVLVHLPQFLDPL
jgi:hypothetical protein